MFLYTVHSARAREELCGGSQTPVAVVRTTTPRSLHVQACDIVLLLKVHCLDDIRNRSAVHYAHMQMHGDYTGYSYVWQSMHPACVHT